MKHTKSLKLLSLTIVVALACGLAACKGFGHSSEDPSSSEAAASSSKTEILASLTDEELQELISGEMTIDQIAEKRAEAAAASSSTSGSAESPASSGLEVSTPEASEEEPAASSRTETSSSTSGTSAAPAEPAYEAEIRSLISQLYAVRAKAEGGLNSAVSSAKAEYKALPAEKQTQTKKISICMSKAGELKSLESSCDKEVEEIVSQMRTILTENGQSTALADQALSTYKSEKSAMYSSLMSQLYG